MKKHGIICMFILMIIVSMITGCGSNSEPVAEKPVEEKTIEEKTVEEKVLTYVNFRDLRDLNPHIYSGELFAQNLLFESLIQISDDGSFEPWLAESYEVSEDGLTYTFKLREDVSFHDGVKFNAETAKANFDAILDNAQRHTWLESVRLMMAVKDAGGECVEATDEYELTLRLAEPYYPFLVELGVTRPFRFISPESFIDGTSKNGVGEMNGTGPYMLKENKVDEYSVFVVNDSYWGTKPEIDKIIAKVIPDNQTRSLALENGEVDLIYGTNMVDAETFNKFTSMDGYSSVISEPLATRMMLMNTTDEILSDVLVRRAISHATDKSIISEGIFSGVESPADTLLAPTVPYANVGLKPYEFSREKAEKLLDEAGWVLTSGSKYRMKDDKELEITLNYDTNKPTDKSISEFLQGEYEKVGIKLNILGEEEQAYRDRMKAGDFTFTFNISWGTPYDPQSFIGGMRNPVYGDYFAQLGLDNKEELDQNILEALKSVDEAKRQQNYKYVLETLHNEAVYLPLTYERNRAVFNDKVKNVTFNPSQFEVPMERMRVEQ